MHQVYDVTPFLDDHPGGDEILLTATGMISKISVNILNSLFITSVDI